MGAQPIRTITGRLVFLKDGGGEWGRENFSVTEHEVLRTYRSCMEMDDYDIFRETNWSMTREGLPLEGFSRETVDGETTAHSWYRLTDGLAEVESWSKEGGRKSHRLPVTGRITHLGLHALMNDCMVSAARGCTDAGVEKPALCLTNSSDGYGRGADSPSIVEPLVTYLGSEPVTVRAGTFEGEHFQVRWSDDVPTYSHFWVLKDCFIPLRLYGASGPVSYELSDLAVHA